MLFVIPILGVVAAMEGLPRGYDVGFVESVNRKQLLPSHGLRAIDLFKDVPESVDWRVDGNGNNIATKLRNQHIPNYCGACWSFAATSALSDRINIVSGKVRQTGLSMQVILNCDKYDGGCHGGDPLTAYQYIHEAGGIPDETCQTYVAEGHDTGRDCNAIDVCMTCDEKGCYAQESYPVWDVEEYGLVNGTEAMMAELQRGPITCSIAVTDDFFGLKDFSVFEDLTGDQDLDHSISVVGYGSTESGRDFWIIRNSWGSYWGESGFARIVRGINNLGIESNCQYAVPANRGEPKMRSPASSSPSLRPDRDTAVSRCRRDANDWEEAGGERIATRLNFDTLLLPESYDIRNVSGVQSYWTEDKNQHTPHYCGSCWAEAVTSALSDRLALLRRGAFPPINLSPQVLINCKYGGDCKGGNPAVAYARIFKFGIPDETCQAYRAQNEDACDDIHVCEECFAGETDASFWPGTCHLVPEARYKKYFVSEYGKVSGVEMMKSEIFSRGPITCGIFASKQFLRFTGGKVIEEAAPNPWTVNHEVVVSGWGRDADGEHWIVRNSWGTAFGENGWFRIRMGGSKNLNIETDCSFGVPSFAPVSAEPWEIETQ